MAYDALFNALIRGEIAGGAVLQKRHIAEALSISRTPVRGALNQLERARAHSSIADGRSVVRVFSIRELIGMLGVRQIIKQPGDGIFWRSHVRSTLFFARRI